MEERTALVLWSAEDGRPLGANDAALRALGCTADDLLAGTVPGLADRVAGLTAASEPWHGRPGATLVVLRPAPAPPDADAETLDLTDTGGLPGRAALWGHLSSTLARAEIAGGTVALLFVDIDDEHEWARHLVPAVAERLLSGARSADLVVRVGAHEFVVVCDGVDGEIGAAGLAARFVDDLSEPVLVGSHQVVPTVRLGVALSGDPGMTHAELAADPDAATAVAKSHGRSRHAAFTAAARRRSATQHAMAKSLGDAIDADELDVHFQPLVSLDTTTVTGFEALARWMPATGPAVPPERFIPVAERSGLIHALGRRVLRQACRYAADRPGLEVAVNVSPRQVRDDLVRRVIESLEESGLPARRLRLELTESAVLDDPDTATTVLRRLTALGVRLSLDDFGTGYSSLLVLRKLPFDQLKIDRSFVRCVAEDRADRDVVAALVSLARAVGVTTTAEGVETDAQAEVLLDLGCDEAQGFLFGRPMGTEACDAWLATSGRPA